MGGGLGGRLVPKARDRKWWWPSDAYDAGQKGVWLHLQDKSTVFQDAAATIPADYGDVIGCILDKSGNGWHATQTNEPQKPIYTLGADGFAYAYFDGVDDCLDIGVVDLSHTSQIAIALGMNKRVDAQGFVLELGNYNTDPGSFAVAHSLGNFANWRTWGRGASGSPSANIVQSAPDRAGFSSEIDLAQPRVEMVRTKGGSATSAAATGGGTFSSTLNLRIGRRNANSNASALDLYGLVLTDYIPDDITKSRYWARARAGEA